MQMGISAQLRTIDDGFKIVASFPELKDKPIVIGECDPEGCAACQGPQLAYAPWTKVCQSPPDGSGKRVCFTGRDGRVESGVPVVAAVASQETPA